MEGTTLRLMLVFSLVLLCSLLLSFCGYRTQDGSPVTEPGPSQQREEMVESQLKGRGIANELVLEAMRKVPRHLFMPPEVRQYAYIDSPVPIGAEQTISQPYIVALMTQIVDPKPQDRALEVGTGSGYQAAVLSELVREVFTIEIIPALAQRAGKALSELGYDGVEVRQGDGYQGWPEKAPFDIILITAAPEEIPQPLIDQLAEGGRLVVPLGPAGDIQTLTLLTKVKGQITRTSITSVRFVPMTGEAQR
ncbi:MAG: protein-L-isoaspartate(D-aspartate) O-methyltransferase [Acidobacteria bacterium]|nr:protein-L-isoaspartate(D-aspartate) O-methyltransferase [Acidobacteriota bacterium]